MSDDEDDTSLDVEKLIAAKKEKQCIKAANVKFRQEIAMKDCVVLLPDLRKRKRKHVSCTEEKEGKRGYDIPTISAKVKGKVA